MSSQASDTSSHTSGSSMDSSTTDDSVSEEQSRPIKRPRVETVGENGEESTKPVTTLYESDVNQLLSQFECPVCTEYITPPILQCLKGHIICKPCNGKLKNKTCPNCRDAMPSRDSHNLSLEQMAVSLKLVFPCKFKPNGCSFTSLLSEKADHEKSCPHEPCLCPLIGVKCNWSGNIEQVVQHLIDDHKYIVRSGNRCCRTLKLNQLFGYENSNYCSLFKCFDQHFLIYYVKKPVEYDHLMIKQFVQFIGEQREADKFRYSFEANSSSERMLFEGTPLSIRQRISFTNAKGFVTDSSTAKDFVKDDKFVIECQIDQV